MVKAIISILWLEDGLICMGISMNTIIADFVGKEMGFIEKMQIVPIKETIC